MNKIYTKYGICNILAGSLASFKRIPINCHLWPSSWIRCVVTCGARCGRFVDKHYHYFTASGFVQIWSKRNLDPKRSGVPSAVLNAHQSVEKYILRCIGAAQIYVQPAQTDQIFSDWHPTSSEHSSEIYIEVVVVSNPLKTVGTSRARQLGSCYLA